MAAAVTFFQHQHLARRNSRLMVVLFLLAVSAVVFAVDLVLGMAWLLHDAEFTVPVREAPGLSGLLSRVPLSLYAWGAVGTAGIIGIVSLVNIVRLADGGATVAKMVGARRVLPNTNDPLERRLLNVVEEMAIASGVRLPAVYVMDEERGINAFAAGYQVSSAVVAVTRGTLETLTRDELQGVIAHEFSHILNGDMRLNIRMLGMLAGIVFIGSIGEFLMRARGRSSSRDSGGIIVVGLALFLIGYVGLLFARLIKSAVARQREYLADASSVQFTRNPEGIAGALDQIRGASSLISNRYAEELSHMFFSRSVTLWLGGLFDTHPPIDERINRVYPRFRATGYRERRAAAIPDVVASSGAPPGVAAPLTGAVAAGATPSEGRRQGDLGTAWGRSAAASAALVGTLDAAKVDYASRLLASLPPELLATLRDVQGAGAVLVALLLAPREEVMREQLAALESAGLAAIGERARLALALTRRLGPGYRLPVIDLALPALKMAQATRKNDVLRALEVVIHADQRVTLDEFVALTLVRTQLAPDLGRSASGRRKLKDMTVEISAVLSLVAHAGIRADAVGERRGTLQRALAAAAREMDLDDALRAPDRISLEDAGRALHALRELAPLQQAVLVRGLFAAVSVDGAIRLAEAEVMRLVGAVLDCPLPPLLAEIDPATLEA